VSWWHRTKVRLGLEDEFDDDEYYDDNEYYEPEEDEQPRRGVPNPYDTPHGGSPSVRRVDRDDYDRAERGRDRDDRYQPSLRSVPTGAASVTPMSPNVKMFIVEPRSFTEAQSIADRFRQGTPVIMKLTMTKPDLHQRYIDFASGLVYGLGGGLQKIDDRVFMLTPHNFDVSDAQRRQMRDTGVFSID
jgi:cell division inhibitor SepF